MATEYTQEQVNEMVYTDSKANQKCGWTADNCGKCKSTTNIVNFMGWWCHKCGHFNLLDWSGNHQFPHDNPDFGPTKEQLRIAYENLAG